MQDQRRDEITTFVNILNELCLKNNVSLVPHTSEGGQQFVILVDNETNKRYALIEDREQKGA